MKGFKQLISPLVSVEEDGAWMVPELSLGSGLWGARGSPEGNTLVTFHPAILLDKFACPQVAQPPWWSNPPSPWCRSLEGSKVSFFYCLIPSSSLLLGTNAWHTHMGRGSRSPNNQDCSQKCPLQLASPWASGSHLFLTGPPWACISIKGPTQLRSKERYWGLVWCFWCQI